jgi:hypothetical protein
MSHGRNHGLLYATDVIEIHRHGRENPTTVKAWLSFERVQAFVEDGPWPPRRPIGPLCRTHTMTAGANQIALRDLGQDFILAVADHTPDSYDLRTPHVIPIQAPWRERLGAINARTVFEGVPPSEELTLLLPQTLTVLIPIALSTFKLPPLTLSGGNPLSVVFFTIRPATRPTP